MTIAESLGSVKEFILSFTNIPSKIQSISDNLYNSRIKLNVLESKLNGMGDLELQKNTIEFIRKERENLSLYEEAFKKLVEQFDQAKSFYESSKSVIDTMVASFKTMTGFSFIQLSGISWFIGITGTVITALVYLLPKSIEQINRINLQNQVLNDYIKGNITKTEYEYRTGQIVDESITGSNGSNEAENNLIKSLTGIDMNKVLIIAGVVFGGYLIFKNFPKIKTTVKGYLK